MASLASWLARMGLMMVLFALLAACAASPAPPPTATPAPPTEPPAAVPMTARPYALGTTDVQVDVGFGATELLELRGTVAAPTSPGRYPLALVLHGSHTVCPTPPDQEEEPFSCSQVVQQRNDPGFAYLLEALAERGFIALAPDLNMAFRSPFDGEANALDTSRVQLILDRQLEALRTGDQAFALANGVEADLTQRYLIGHSRGGMAAYGVGVTWEADEATEVRGLLLLAPMIETPLFQPVPFTAAPTLDLPLAVVLPSCDGDVGNLDGQHYVEAARIDPQRQQPAMSILLPGANHNFFNDALTVDDSRSAFGFCDPETPRMPRADQRGFLEAFAPALLEAWRTETIFDLELVAPAQPVPATIAGVPTQSFVVYPAVQRRPVLSALRSTERDVGPLGGAVTVQDATLEFCAYQSFGAGILCRPFVQIPGGPAQMHFVWESAEARLRVEVPPTAGDMRDATALHLRLALDPTDPRMPTGEAQRLRIVLQDQAGATAEQVVSIALPTGVLGTNRWSDPVYLGSVRLPLSQFEGIDRAQLAAIELYPESAGGALFLADLELVSATEVIEIAALPEPFGTLDVQLTGANTDPFPPESQLFVRLRLAGVAEGQPDLVVVQTYDLSDQSLPLEVSVPYNRATLDGRNDYELEAGIFTPDGTQYNTPQPVLAIRAGEIQTPLELIVEPIVIVEAPTPTPDATLRVVIRAPSGQPFAPGLDLSVVLVERETGAPLAGATEVTTEATVETFELELAYNTADVKEGGVYALSVQVFQDLFTVIASNDDLEPIDLNAEVVELQLNAVQP
ncbi:YbaY family lipoprotein [Candidatus Chloroploca sp. M-50]|uniref:YbaY family lipoprotein n=1 Tax=Candidatus Chloroploca mongolica TaxID=2528176 RepID=A0ABS4DEH6_9CHLR|nr:YbaY family lipoprotein [Candidatus Chloroploca mongolica]MBP1467857.1 YbaY family lipoprotein [Candidatus Chloroploca mongolica]